MRPNNRSIYLVFPIVLSFNASAAMTVKYQHTDVLGSLIAETDSNGHIIQKTNYQAYGEQIGGQKAGIGYTGHLEDTDLGLTYMQQRYYDPEIGRFYSNDPVGFNAANLMMFNRYAYANNNPYKFVDPDGRCSTSPDAKATDVCQIPDSLKMSSVGKTHLKKHENNGYAVKTAHNDGANNLTAGYGHKVTSSDNITLGQEISEETADSFLDADLEVAESTVKDLLGTLQVSQNEFDALTDLAYNVGAGTLDSSNSPGLHEGIKAGDYDKISNNLRYTKANGVVLSGLVTRSAERKSLFLGK